MRPWRLLKCISFTVDRCVGRPVFGTAADRLLFSFRWPCDVFDLRDDETWKVVRLRHDVTPPVGQWRHYCMSARPVKIVRPGDCAKSCSRLGPRQSASISTTTSWSALLPTASTSGRTTDSNDHYVCAVDAAPTWQLRLRRAEPSTSPPTCTRRAADAAGRSLVSVVSVVSLLLLAASLPLHRTLRQRQQTGSQW